MDDIIAEIAAARVTERGSRADDKATEAAMEDRKKAGIFLTLIYATPWNLPWGRLMTRHHL